MITPSVGEQFGKWKVAESSYRPTPYSHMFTPCRCQCGCLRKVRTYELLHGKSKMCPRCRSHQNAMSHGHSYGPEYNSWVGMLQRCTNPKNTKYASYGARSITVCERWKSFENFLADMGRRPGPEYSIDRKDNDGNYEPDNCRWATPVEQARNTRANRILSLGGQTLTEAEWAERLGVKQRLISQRLGRGWTVERTLSTPVRVPL
jgi:hypothetical protein